MNFAAARQNMIESQVRPNGIVDSRIIAAMSAVAREAFVPEAVRDLAYMDEDIRLESGEGDRHLMEPMAFARLLQMAGIRAGDIVLDIGCGSGYSCAVLGELAEAVVGIEEDAKLAETAGRLLEDAQCTNAVVLNQPHAGGCPAEAPFDVIVVNGRVEKVPQTILDQLKDGGRLVAVVGDRAVTSSMLWTRQDGSFASRRGADASVPVVPGFGSEKPAFVF